jgi:hypothetical protein
MVNAAVRRSDIIFAEAEEKKRRTENEGEETTPAAEATMTGGFSGSGGPSLPTPGTLPRPIRPGEQVPIRPSEEFRGRKRAADEPPDDPRATNADTPEVEVIAGTKRQADTSVADIAPQSGDGVDVAAMVIAHSEEAGDELISEKVG